MPTLQSTSPRRPFKPGTIAKSQGGLLAPATRQSSDAKRGCAADNLRPTVLTPMTQKESDQMTPGSPPLADAAKASTSPQPQEEPQSAKPRPRMVDTFRGVSRALFSRPLGIAGAIAILLAGFVLKPTGTGPSMCTLQRTTGYPCPGCGLTRSVTSFYHGHFDWAWHYHPFGPLIALLFALLAILSVLPKRQREPILGWLEKHDHIVAWIFMTSLIAMVAYGILRIVLLVLGYPGLEWWLVSDTQDPPFVTNP